MSSNVPVEMTREPRWVLWRYLDRGGRPTKVPYQVTGACASSTNPEHWSTFEEVQAKNEEGGFSGIGFVLGDGWAGVDLDNCIADTGEMAPWALDIVLKLGSYAEVSPSKSGVKIFCKGKLPGDKGRRTKIEEGNIEMYSSGRYFTVTSRKLAESPDGIANSSSGLDLVYREHFGESFDIFDDTAFELCRRTLAALPDSISGEEGHNDMFRACCEIRRFGLSEEESWKLIHWYNDNKCYPAWSQHEMRHKWKSACRVTKEELKEKIEELEKASSFDLGLVTHREFIEKEYTQKFIVNDIVVEGEHLIIGGPQKTLKTSLLVDLAISLSGGGKFLGHFGVPEPQPAIIVSGESGGATLQKMAVRIQEARGVDPGDNLYWGLRLPNLTLAGHLEALGNEIERTGAKLLAVDPAYLSLLTNGNADGASNVFKMGSILNGYGVVGVKTGCTMCLVHHTRSNVKIGTVPGLPDLAFSGFQEWARQWVLLNHAEKREGGKMHLNMVVGGSAGHGGEYKVDVDEGQPKDPLIGRLWNVEVTNKSDVDAVENTDDAGAARREKIVSQLQGSEGMTKKALSALTGINNAALTTDLKKLVDSFRVLEDTAGTWKRYYVSDLI